MMGTLLEKFRFWFSGPSLTNRALEILGEANLMPSRIYRGNYGVVNMYFFKKLEDAYALLVIDEEKGEYTILVKNGHATIPVTILKDDTELRNWAHQASNWIIYNSPFTASFYENKI